jgi:hypothetical protein
MLTPEDPKIITKPTPRRVSPEEKSSMSCTKTCAPGSELNLRACKCVQKMIGPRDTTFNSETGRFDRNPQTIGPKPMNTPPPMKKGGVVVKGSQLRRQASTKGLRTSKKHR